MLCIKIRSAVGYIKIFERTMGTACWFALRFCDFAAVLRFCDCTCLSLDHELI
jgi:hypothetical protein